jgi:hypothetical protein
MNLTLVAFYGSKPNPLIQILKILQTALHAELGPAFTAYAVEQVHATIIGLEGWRVGVDVFSANMSGASAKSFPMDLRGLLQFMQEMPPVHIRMGGFAASGSYPFTSHGLHPYIRSFTLHNLQAVVIGWPVAREAFPMALDSLRRQCRRYNVLHKYHQTEKDVDNDFFLVLGRLNRNTVSDEKVEQVQATLRQILAHRAPLDLRVQQEDLSVVAYSDTQLPTSSSKSYPLAEALATVDELKLLYRESFPVKL